MTIDGAHGHADIERRLKLLEDAQVPVPPPVPPTTGPAWWVPPTIVRSVQLPPSIATDGSQVGTQIKTFLAGIPDGTQVLGAGPTAKYGITGSCLPSMAGHNHWTLDWLGATIDNAAVAPIAGGPPGSAEYLMSAFYGHWSEKPFPTHITFRNVIVNGHNPNPGTLNGHEYAAAVQLMGAQFVELDNVQGTGLWGDLLTLNENTQYIWAHGTKTTNVGRNNMSVVCASHVLWEDAVLGKSGYCVYDLEPEPGSIADIDDIVIRRSTDKGFASNSTAKSWLAVDGADSGKKVTNLVVDTNSSTGPLAMTVGGATGKARPGHVAITRNSGAAGGYLKAQHVDFLSATGNTNITVQPPTDCPGAITSPNP